jgi:SpoIIAA-like
MLNVNLDEEKGVAYLEPNGALSKDDFESAASIIDPYIKKAGELKGIIINVESFPGWDSFAALIKHFKFIKDHHHKVSRIAFVTDSPIGGFAEHVASHFVSAVIKHFPYNRLKDAQEWVSSGVK